MINTWFISDTHFSHKKIIEYEKEHRPFDTLQEMHDTIIERWNKTVKPKDIIYHLGDFAFGKENIKIAEKLNGSKRLIMGNHDMYPINCYTPYFQKIYGAFYWKGCLLTHIPVHEYNLSRHLESYGITSKKILNVHGHLHSKKIQRLYEYPDGATCIHIKEDDPNYFNVSCEQNDLTPIHADIILKALEELK